MSSTAHMGPLTAIWTPPSSCGIGFPTPTYVPQGIQTMNLGYTCTGETNDCGTSKSCATITTFTSQIDQACFPPATSDPNRDTGLQGYYSPGLICPAGFTKACETTFGGTGNFQPVWSLTAGETAIGCCPTNFNCFNDLHTQLCTATATSTSFTMAFCYDTTSELDSYAVPTTDLEVKKKMKRQQPITEIVTAVLLNAPMYQLNYRSSDMPSVSNARSQPTTTAPAPGNASTNSSTNPPRPTQSITTGSKVAIGFGVIMIAAAAISGIVWAIMRHRRANKNILTPLVGGPMPGRYKQLLEQQGIELLHNSEEMPAELYQPGGVHGRQYGMGPV